MSKLNLAELGFGPDFLAEAAFYPDLHAGRVVSQTKDLYRVLTDRAELTATVSGKFRHGVRTLSAYPAVGDFVMLDRPDAVGGKAVIHRVLTRKSVFIRRAAGTSNQEQVVAANIDTVFICMSLNSDFNLRRLERYLGVAWDSGAFPVVVLTKADLCPELRTRMRDLEAVAQGVDVLVTSGMSADGYNEVNSYLGCGRTVAFIGSSGVGKSTLINRLLGGDVLDTRTIRKDDKGRHTTTRRELIALPGGGAVIDTPGMRELGIEGADLAAAFADIDELAAQCRFHDCAHKKEPGCAVQKAVTDGLLSGERLENYHKLKLEAKYEGLNSRQIETEKITAMFAEVGGVKNARKLGKEKNRNRRSL